MHMLSRTSEKIDTYQEEILNRNYRNLQKFTFGGMILTGGISFAALISMGHMYFTVEYCICFLHFVLCYLYTRFILKKNVKYTLPAFYLTMLPIYTIGILMGTFLDTASNAMTIMILLCTLTMFITDKPQHILSYLLTIAVVFIVCSYLCKSTDLFISDLVNLTIYLSIGIGVNMLTLSDRVESAENYVLIRKKADIDMLTSILNRGAGENSVIKLLETGRRGSFFMVDIDDFKHFNDSYGHQVGDEVICAVSRQLENVFRNTDIVWRLGGDEFAVFAVDLLDKAVCQAHMHEIQDGLQNIRTSYPEPFTVKVSIGCTICHTPEHGFDYLYKVSDDALYAAKDKGKDCYIIQEI